MIFFERMQFVRWSALIAVSAAVITGCDYGSEPSSNNKRLRAVAVYATPIEEPWNHAVHQAMEKAESEHGIEYTYDDNVQPSEFEKVLRRYAEEGYDLIVGDAFADEETVRRVAAEYSDVPFVFGSGLGPASPNFSVFDNWIHEPAYLAGMIAGSLTESHVIGVVGGHPAPEVNRLINAFRAGARETNPEVQLKVVFIESWFDPPKAKEAASTLISQGADVLYAERAGVIEACAEASVPCFGNLIAQHELAPEVVVSSVLWDMWPTVDTIVTSIKDGSYTSSDLAEYSTMSHGGARLAPFRGWEARLPAEIQETVKVRSSEIRSGRFRVPIIESEPRTE